MQTNTHQIKITKTNGFVRLFLTFADVAEFTAGNAPTVALVPIRASVGDIFTVSQFIEDPTEDTLEMAVCLYAAHEPSRIYRSMCGEFQYPYVGWTISSKYYRKV